MTGCGNDPRTELTNGDRSAVAEFREYLAKRRRSRIGPWCDPVETLAEIEPDSDYDCIDARGVISPEHDFDEVECRRCGAEPDWEPDDE